MFYFFICRVIGQELSYKPPIYDINAPDLYISLTAFSTYVVLAGFSLGLQGKFTPEALNWLFMKGIVGWFLQVSLLKMSLFSLGGAEAPLLDIVAYAGYAFTGMCLAAGMMWQLTRQLRTSKDALGIGDSLNVVDLPMHGNIFGENYETRSFSEVRSFVSSRHHYLLLFIALAQFRLFIWLGNITVNWLF
ncbi:putative Yif1 family protein [Helianthus anomalus]